MKNKIMLPFLLSVLTFAGCKKPDKEKTMQGYVPIYSDQIETDLKLSASPRALAKPGKIYIYNDLLLINEFEEGVHIVDNSNKEAPVKIGFYEIQGCTDMAIKNAVLYANYAYGMVAIDISNPTSATFLSYTPYPNQTTTLHPEKSMSVRNKDGLIVYKCPEEGKGNIIGWKLSQISGQYCTIR